MISFSFCFVFSLFFLVSFLLGPSIPSLASIQSDPAGRKGKDKKQTKSKRFKPVETSKNQANPVLCPIKTQ